MLPSVEDCLSNLSAEFDVLDVVVCDDVSMIDLAVKIQQCHRSVFADNQRLVFVITKDVGQAGSHGQVLQNLQIMINDVDISNFFVCVVSTNPDIKDHYDYILKNNSSDSIPFHLYPCNGVYKQLASEQLESYSKYASVKDHTSKISALRQDQKNLLFENKSFCMLAWAGINIEPNNRVTPCCEFANALGDASQQSLSEIWNSQGWKKLRQDMLAGIPITECDACYQKEKMGRDTLRKSSNRLLTDQINLIDQTQVDGQLDTFNLQYWDIRYNNLCNLACRSCSPSASSSWYQPAQALGLITQAKSPILLAGSNEHDIFGQIIQHIDHVKQIYFAGGEPSMIEQFYKILELLDSRGRNDVALCYNINMSRLQLKNKSLLDLWKRFPKVSIGASLDGENQRGEYLRQGLDWKDVLENRQQMMAQCPHIDFYVTATVSVLNVLHLPDFHKSWVAQNLLKPEDFNIQILFDPVYLRIDHSPMAMKEKIKKVYERHLEWLIPRDPLGRATFGFRSVLRYIENCNEFNTPDFWHNVNALDQYHQTKMLDTFPELHLLPQDL